MLYRFIWLFVACLPVAVHAQNLGEPHRKEVLIQAPIRLHEWLLSAEGTKRLPYDGGLNWISSAQRQTDIDRSEKLLAYLAERSLMAADDPFGAGRLRALVQALPYRGRVALPSSDARWLEANKDADPILLPGDRLISYQRPRFVSVVLTSGKVCRINHRPGQPALAYAKACLGDVQQPERAFNRGLQDVRVWIGQPDGQVFTAFMDLTRDTLSPEPAPGAWIWVPQGWAEQEEWFSEALTELLAGQGPAGEYVRSFTDSEAGPVSRKTPLPITRSQFGSAGLIQMPSARMSPEDTLSVSRTFSEPYRRINIQVQALPWLEYGLRYTDIRNRLYGPASFSGDQTYIDKSLDLKIRLLEETDSLPQIALGMIDAVGTGLFSSEYIVASKQFGNFDVSGGLAFGVLGAGGDFSNPLGAVVDRFKNRRQSDIGQGGNPALSTWFTGPASPFLGVQWLTPWPNWIAKLEYSANDGSREPYLAGTIRAVKPPSSRFNAGLVYRLNDWVDLLLGVERGYQFIAGVNLYTSLNKKPLPKILDRPLPTVLSEPTVTTRLLSEYSGTVGVAKAVNWQALSKEIEQVSFWRVETIQQDGQDIIVRFYATPGVYAQDRIERIGRVLHQALPPEIKRFFIRISASGLSITSVILDRQRFVEDRTQLVAPAVRSANPAIVVQNSEEMPAAEGQLIHDQLGRRRLGDFAWGNVSARIGANYSQLLGGPTGFWLFQLGLGARVEWRPHPSTWLDASLNLRLIDNYNNFYNNPTRNLPPVRTFIREYLDTENPLTMPSAQLTHVGVLRGLGPGHFYSIYGGWLEWMFGGVGAEYLYRPWRGPLAFGLDVNWVRQRDFHQRFSFMEYSATTGHGTVYWDTGWNGVLVKAKAGQYLAGDRGITLDVSRTFLSGATIGALATKTNVSAAEFGEGSFDKVLYLKIPFDLMLPKRSNFDGLFVWRNLTSNAGAILGRRHALFDLTEKRDPRALQYGTQ